LPLLAVIVSLLAVPNAHAAPATGFTDDFTTLDPARWVVGDHALGRGRLDPANVSVAGGQLALGLPAGRLDGAEVHTAATFATGTFRARIRVANAPSSLTGFFLYAPPDFASEVDVEILDDPSGTVMFTTYAGGAQTHTETRSLGFDPTAAFHDYEIALDHRSVTFRVDGAALRTWTSGVPRTAMPLFLNAWYPAWLAGTPAAGGAATLVDSVSVSAR
jgi:beta-glucanase (GH16 family)